MDFDRLAHAVREARNTRGWRQEDLADRAHVGVSSVQNIEKGRPFSRVPSSYRKIETALGWESGSCMAVLKGGDPTPRQQGVQTTVHDTDTPTAASDLSDLPQHVQLSLGEGTLFDADVMELTLPGETLSIIIVAKSGAYDTEESREQLAVRLAAWRQAKRRIKQAVEEPEQSD